MSEQIPDGTRDGQGYWLQGVWHPDDEQYHRLFTASTLHNLDIEITALREGWGAWCQDYQRMDKERRAALGKLDQAVQLLRQAVVRLDDVNIGIEAIDRFLATMGGT